MQKITYIFLIIAILAGCQNTKTDKQLESKVEKDNLSQNENTPRSETTEKVEKSILIKDSSDYSIKFLKELEKTGINNISLISNLMIIEEIDTVLFPEIPEIGVEFMLTAKKDHIAIALTVIRINQSTIDYKIEMVEFGNASYNFSGQADIRPQFYFGAETDESSLSGVSYLSTEFVSKQDSCHTIVRLGREEESGRYLLGKIKKNCNNKIKDIILNDYPTLIEKYKRKQ